MPVDQRRRSSDQLWLARMRSRCARGWRRVRATLPENWYRDVWLLAITAVTLVALSNANGAADRVQRERASSIARACAAQNARNVATVKQLDRELAEIALRDPRRAAQARESREFTVKLIDALSPYQDCARAVHDALFPPHRPIPLSGSRGFPAASPPPNLPAPR